MLGFSVRNEGFQAQSVHTRLIPSATGEKRLTSFGGIFALLKWDIFSKMMGKILPEVWNIDRFINSQLSYVGKRM